jgi:hypothetical protein
MADFVVKGIMIGCVFIQTNETMLKGHEFIHAFDMVFAIDIRFNTQT